MLYRGYHVEKKQLMVGWQSRSQKMMRSFGIAASQRGRDSHDRKPQLH